MSSQAMRKQFIQEFLDIMEKLTDGMPCAACNNPLDGRDNILGAYCSPECAEHEERCWSCNQGPSWCRCLEDYADSEYNDLDDEFDDMYIHEENEDFVDSDSD